MCNHSLSLSLSLSLSCKEDMNIKGDCLGVEAVTGRRERVKEM
jgi:hypothetical protein